MGPVSASGAELPVSLRDQFAALARRWRLEQTRWVVAGLFTILAASFLGVFIADRLGDTPRWLRLIWLAAGVGFGAWMALRWVLVRFVRPPGLEALARLVQRRHRRLGDRVLGAVELAQPKEAAAGVSPALRRAALRQVAEEAARYDFLGAVDTGRSARLGALAAGLAVVAGLFVLVAPGAGSSALARWLAPWAPFPRYTFVRLDELPAKRLVPRGEASELAASVRYLSGWWRPRRAVARFGPLQLGSARAVENDRLILRLPPVSQPGVLEVRLGDVTQRVLIEPVDRPALEGITAEIALPPYLSYPPQSEPLLSGVLPLLPGSRVGLRGKVTRALRTAHLELGQGAPLPLETDQAEFRGRDLDLTGAVRTSLRWIDDLGFGPAAPWVISIQPKEDTAPRVEFRELPRQLALLHSESIRLRAAAQDDFGVREIVLRHRALDAEPASGAPPAPAAAPSNTMAVAASPQLRRLDGEAAFSPGAAGIAPGTAVELVATATDFLPGRVASESAPLQLYVIGEAEHAELIRQALESIFIRLEDVARDEESLVEKAAELAAWNDERLASTEAADSLGQQAERQTTVVRSLEQMAREGTQLLREAMRNPLFSDDQVRDWAGPLREMQEVAQQPMRQAAASLGAAQAAKAERSSNLDRAQEQEEKALAGVRQVQQRLAQGLDDLQAQTLAQRLRKIAADEEAIEGRLFQLIPETVGLLVTELPPRLKRANGALAASQAEVQQTAQTLQQEISRFFERTRKPSYGEVSLEMTEARAAEALERLGQLMQANVSVEAAQTLDVWVARFEAWADRLEPPRSSAADSAGQEGQGGERDQALLRQLMAMLRMRHQQAKVLDRTKTVDRERGREAAAAPVADDSRVAELHRAQRTLAGEMILFENVIDALDPMLEETQNEMQQARRLLAEPRTDAPVQTAQAKAVALLSDMINLINEQAQRQQSAGSGGPGDATSEEMAFLTQLAAAAESAGIRLSQGQAGGGSEAGGEASAPGAPLPQGRDGKEASGRRVTRGSGAAPRPVPTEFRQALEHYFRALEQPAQ
jgi:hypothetical protein